MKTSELLRKAADEIRRRGWYQGDYGSDLGDEGFRTCRVCSLGAVNAVAHNGDPWVYPRLKGTTHFRAVEILEGAVGGTLPQWNDDPERTIEEVLDVFSRAAEKAEADERAAVAAEAEEN